MNRKFKNGIIDDEVLERNGVFILRRENKLDEVFYDGNTIIKEPDDYYNVELISGGNSSYCLHFKVQNASSEYGIIYMYKDGVRKEIEYPFGKANEMVVDQEKVYLYNEMKTKTGKGVWNDPNLGTLDPIYESFCYDEVNLPFYPKMPDSERVFVDRGVKWHFSYDKFSRKVELMRFSKKNSGTEKHGVMVKQYDKRESGYHSVYTFQDFISGKNSIRMDTEHQYFICETIENGKKCIDLIPYTYQWDIYTKGAVVYGRPTLMIPFQFEERFEDYQFIPNSNYLKVKVDGKWGLLEVHLPRDYSPYDDSYRKGGYNRALLFYLDRPEDIEYCADDTFIVAAYTQKVVVKFGKQYSDSTLHTQPVYSDFYPAIEKFNQGYQMTTENGEKIYGMFQFVCKGRVYSNTFRTTEKSYLKLGQYGKDIVLGFTELKDNQITFDIINSSTQVILSNVKEITKHPKERFTKYLLADDCAVLFDETWHKVLEAKDIDSYIYYDALESFDITHSDGTHSLVSREGISEEKKTILNPMFGTYDQVTIDCNRDSYCRVYTIVTSKKTGDSKQPYCMQQYYVQSSDWNFEIKDFNQVFDGVVVDCHPLPNINRMILTVFDSEKEKNVTGVIENKKGTILIPFDYDSTTYDKQQIEQFICLLGKIKLTLI